VSEHEGGDRRIERVQRKVAATPTQIFDLLADPRMHSVIDGSGSVKGALDSAPERLTLGSRFGMSMRIGMPYHISNEVVEFDVDRRIAWRHFGGHIWRYVLEPTDVETDDGTVVAGTLVTEEFEWGASKAPWMLQLVRAVGRNRRSMEATLDRLAAHFA
jgi:hypothetical protein